MGNKGILLFGGTFDPIHNGHLIIARSAAEKLGVEKAVLIPSAHPPHKEDIPLTVAAERLAMVRLAVEGDGLFEVSDCELRREGPSYTLDTVGHFRERWGREVHLYWLVGADTIAELCGWYKVGQLMEECTIVTAGRPGYENDGYLSVLRGALNEMQIARLKAYLLDTPRIDISATDIRRRVQEGLSIDHLVPQRVGEYIIRKKLYRIE